MTPFFGDEQTTLYLGDCREVVPALDLAADCIIADPPYGETSLAWDRWPDGWPTVLIAASRSMWCFGSMRMFLDRRDEFAAWKLSQDIIWEKPVGSSLAADRFRRVHEFALHWYLPPWGSLYREPPRVLHHGPNQGRRSKGGSKGAHLGVAGTRRYVDDGTRIVRSVVRAPQVRHGFHATEKPVEILDPLIRYACPPGGTVLDPFAGSGSTAVAARLSARRAVLVEADERYCEVIARRLAQDVLPVAAGAHEGDA